MKTARDVAIDAVQEAGSGLRRAVDAFERAIESDRRMRDSLRAPS